MITKWDARFLDLAALVASWSRDPSTQVGAVIADGINRIISTGYNGFPRGVPDDDDILQDRDERLLRTIHAEENAILFAGRQLDGCTIYVTHPPCARCAAKIIQVGIARVVAPMPPGDFVQRWNMDLKRGTEMMIAAGVTFEYLQRAAIDKARAAAR